MKIRIIIIITIAINIAIIFQFMSFNLNIIKWIYMKLCYIKIVHWFYGKNYRSQVLKKMKKLICHKICQDNLTACHLRVKFKSTMEHAGINTLYYVNVRFYNILFLLGMNKIFIYHVYEVSYVPSTMYMNNHLSRQWLKIKSVTYQ